jgi:hypothetical protein
MPSGRTGTNKKEVNTLCTFPLLYLILRVCVYIYVYTTPFYHVNLAIKNQRESCALLYPKHTVHSINRLQYKLL